MWNNVIISSTFLNFVEKQWVIILFIQFISLSSSFEFWCMYWSKCFIVVYFYLYFHTSEGLRLGKIYYSHHQNKCHVIKSYYLGELFFILSVSLSHNVPECHDQSYLCLSQWPVLGQSKLRFVDQISRNYSELTLFTWQIFNVIIYTWLDWLWNSLF